MMHALPDTKLRWVLPQRFAPAMEKDFQHDYVMRMAPLRRVTSVVALLFWVSYLSWDFMAASADPVYNAFLWSVVTIRIFGTVCLLILCALSYSPHYAHNARFTDNSIVSVGGLIFASAGVMFVMAPRPYNQMLFIPGILLAMMFVFSLPFLLWRPLFRLAGLFTLGCTALLLWAAHAKVGVQPDPTIQDLSWIAPAMWMSAAITLGCTVSVLLEIFARQSFLTRIDLQALNQSLTQSSQMAQERLEAVVELKDRLRRQAEDRSREKSRFISSAVHDLRQPVQAQISVLEPLALSIEQSNAKTAGELVELLRQATHSLQKQLSDILDISRLESGGLHPKPIDFNVLELVLDTVSSWQSHAQDERVLIETRDQTGGAGWVHSDPEFVRRIVSNLVSNSIKYRSQTPLRNSRVTLCVLVQDDSLHLAVEDNGIGIDVNLVASQQIFEPFFQANNHLAQGDKGVGLGLAIVKALVSLLPGHELTVQSQPGMGSRFNLQMPKAVVPLASTTSTNDVPPTSLPDRSLPAVLKGVYILLVEDDDLVRTSTAHLLESWGMLVETCKNYAEFQLLLAGLERVPDVLVSDFRLPDGYTALEVVQAARAELDDVPIILFSGESTDFSIMANLNTLPVLRKPVDVAQLHTVLAEACGRKAVHQSSPSVRV